MSQRTDLVAAWDLTAGDELPGGVRILSVHREVRARSVRIVTDEPATAELPGDAPVPVVRRLI